MLRSCMKENKEFSEKFKSNGNLALTNEDYDKLYCTADYLGEETAKHLLRVFKETGIRYCSLKDLTVDSVDQGIIKGCIKRKI